MRGRDIMKSIMEQEKISNADLAKKLEVSNATIWERLNNKNVKDIPVSLMNEMVRAMGYKVIVVPFDCRLPEKGFEVTSKSTHVESTQPTTTQKPKSGRPKIKLPPVTCTEEPLAASKANRDALLSDESDE